MHFDISGSDYKNIPAQYLADMEGSMPLLAERGILSFRYGHVFTDSITIDRGWPAI